MIRLFLIGFLMGCADMVPGVSGGTIAYLTGIYDAWLQAIQSLQFNDFRKIHWRFLIPLGFGILGALLSLSHLLFFLLSAPFTRSLLFAFFLGLIVASACFCLRRAPPKKPSLLGLLVLGGALAFFGAGPGVLGSGGCSFGWLFFCGILAAGAMLLPGVSGCYLLHVLGVYTLALTSLSHLSEGWSLLLPLFFGVVLGVLLFSRLISWLLATYRPWALAFLTGLMLGGARSVWPFFEGELLFCIPMILLGFIASILLEIKTSRWKFKIFNS